VLVTFYLCKAAPLGAAMGQEALTRERRTRRAATCDVGHSSMSKRRGGAILHAPGLAGTEGTLGAPWLGNVHGGEVSLHFSGH